MSQYFRPEGVVTPGPLTRVGPSQEHKASIMVSAARKRQVFLIRFSRMDDKSKCKTKGKTCSVLSSVPSVVLTIKIFAACDDFWSKTHPLPLFFLRISAPPAVSAVRGFGCGFVAPCFRFCL